MLAALSRLPLLRGIKAIKVSVNVVACNSPTTATVLGTSAARWGGSSAVLVDGWDFTSLPMSVSSSPHSPAADPRRAPCLQDLGGCED